MSREKAKKIIIITGIIPFMVSLFVFYVGDFSGKEHKALLVFILFIVVVASICYTIFVLMSLNVYRKFFVEYPENMTNEQILQLPWNGAFDKDKYKIKNMRIIIVYTGIVMMYYIISYFMMYYISQYLYIYTQSK